MGERETSWPEPLPFSLSPIPTEKHSSVLSNY